MHSVSNRNHHNNDWYEELCALATIGEISPSEFEELQQHLADCSDCRQLYADFRRISADDVGFVAVLKRPDSTPDEGAGPLDEQELLSRFLARAQHERLAGSAFDRSALEVSPARDRTLRSLFPSLLGRFRRPGLVYGALALVLSTAVAIGSYRLREVQLSPTLADLRSQLSTWKSQAETRAAQAKSASESFGKAQREREALQKSLAEMQNKYSDLQIQQKALQSDLAAVRSKLTQVGQDVESAKASAEGKGKQIADLETRLRITARRAEEQENLAEALRTRLQRTEEASRKALVVPPADNSEAKDLFGARDLHIVDVYDVDNKGKTRRTYGRVYYVEKKFLVFYAFDLEDTRHNRSAAGFQAWGYRQANEARPENLGLFYVDDVALSRWVLKVNNPRVLEHIDAVFVTLEPPNGSKSPQGRRLLYANLAGPPNHP